MSKPHMYMYRNKFLYAHIYKYMEVFDIVHCGFHCALHTVHSVQCIMYIAHCFSNTTRLSLVFYALICHTIL